MSVVLLFDSSKVKARAFAEYARRYGLDELLDCLERNEQAGIVYHREGIMGDYDEFNRLRIPRAYNILER